MTEGKAKRKQALKLFIILVFFTISSAAALLCWPVDTLEISESGNGTLLHRSSVPLGKELSARIIHSVQLTPVIDFYRVQQGQLWGWREAIRSHNAGLPSQAPQSGKFYQSGNWMILEGTDKAWPRIYYRVGTEKLGHNSIILPGERRQIELWKTQAGKRLSVQAGKKRLYRVMAYTTDF